MSAQDHVAGVTLHASILRLRSILLWVFVCSGAIVLVEPSPYEIMFVLAGGLFFLTGLRLNALSAILLLVLLAFNLGGVIGLIPYINERPSVMFVVISIYMMFNAVFFAALMGDDTVARFNIIRSGYIAAAWIAGLAGILGYFHVGGLGELFTRYNRASGTFKDPNVLGTFLVFPIVCIVQSLLLRRAGLIKTAILISVPLLGLFLSFSRGSWGHVVVSLALLFLLHLLMSRSDSERVRLISLGILGVATMVVLLIVALSIEDIRKVFEVRASLDQSYDVGATGRFGDQARSIPMLLSDPNGFGPYRYHTHFNADPHNVYINAFASYGWLGGISYFTLIGLTMFLGWRTVFLRSPFQDQAIAVWSTLFITILQGFQIDTDHWRHFYLLLGLTWGLAAVAARSRARGVLAPAAATGQS